MPQAPPPQGPYGYSPPPTAPKGGNGGLIAIAAVGGFVLLSLVGIGAYFALRSKDDTTAVQPPPQPTEAGTTVISVPGLPSGFTIPSGLPVTATAPATTTAAPVYTAPKATATATSTATATATTTAPVIGRPVGTAPPKTTATATATNGRPPLIRR